MSSSTAEPPPGDHPGGQARDSSASPQSPVPPLNPTDASREDEGGAVGIERSWPADPRPPVPGEEDASGPDPQPPYGDWGKESPLAIMPYPSHHLYAHFQGEGGGDGPAAGPGSAEAGSPVCGGGEGSSTPPVVRWSQSLQHLLEDPQGVHLFQEYLKEECGTCEEVLFWFACNGLRRTDQDPWQLVPIIWKKFIRNYTVKVTEKTYKTINDRINARSIDRNIFDDAQREVEEEIERSTYPSFLKSETYLTYLSMVTQQGGGPGAESPHSPSPSSPGGVNTGVMLPTLHEDCEYEGGTGATQLRLTQEALAATVKRRAAPERRKPEAYAGQYLHGRGIFGGGGVNPYHAVYGTVHLSSRQDSELQSLSSDALTDDTLSCTDSSVDMSIGHPVNPKYIKKQYRLMRENARQNLERRISGGNGHSGVGSGGMIHGGFVPRTHRICHESIPKLKPGEFAALLIEKLEKVQRERESQEKVQQSFKRIQEGDNVSDECRREHAFNSLPPSLLLDKLAQKIPIDDVDPCQAILDEHVSRVWQDSNNDTPARSPGSPRPRSPTSGRRGCTAQSARPTLASQHASKGGGGAHPSMFVSGNYLPSTQLVHLLQGHSVHHPHGHLSHLQGHLPHHPMGHQVHLPPGHLPHPYQASKNWSHARRRDRDVYSTFSSDSGNVADYYEGSERPGPQHLIPKSRSMPDYMENYAGTSSDGGSSGGRRLPGSRRSSSRRPPADLTDSGVSVVSDSGPSLTPSASSTESFHICRRSGSSGGRRSGSGMSMGGTATSGSNTSVSGSLVGGGRMGSQERGAWAGMDPALHLAHSHSLHLPQGPLQPHLPHQEDSKRKSRGGGSHGSGRSGGHSSSHSSGHSRGHSEAGSGRAVGHGEAVPTAAPAATSGSNGSTLRRARPPRHTQSTPTGVVCESGGSSGGGSGGGIGSSQLGTGSGASVGSSTTTAPEVTTIVYNFHDDAVPFVTRVPTFPVTLKRFKQHLPKKGNYRFFFKKHCEEFGLINEEITEDSVDLPLFEGKIFAQIRKAD
ncbi:axin-1-like isoform X5 [Eriocheir sinensis]|uniref:axin-1-like isoform X5 n=1 Tax=Eriocheir sinensis TaxID=95602 RepID=UPI0021C63A06|nr:axin-1-like isoform X5 [Eriocheir sinensis]